VDDVGEDAREPQIVLDDEDHAGAGLEARAIVLWERRCGGRDGPHGRWRDGRQRCRDRRPIPLGGLLRRLDRQHEPEDAAPAERALDGEVASHAAGEVARDREAEAGAAVLAVDAAVRLPERLEDRFLLLGAMPMPESRTEKAIRAGPDDSTRRTTSPSLVNLIAFESRFRRICWRRCGSVRIVGGVPGAVSIASRRPFCTASGWNNRRERVERARERHRLGRHAHLAGLDAREIEDCR
jgi:hypothetical protein